MAKEIRNNKYLSGLYQFLGWAIKYATWDNPIVRGTDAAIKAVSATPAMPQETWFERHSTVAARVVWWCALCGALLKEGTIDVAPVVDAMGHWITQNNFEDLKLNPKNSERWADAVVGIHPYVLAHIISSEGFIEKAYDDNGGNGTLTLGSGFTINDKIHRDFAKKILGRHVGNGASITVAENRILVSEWLKQKIYPQIQQNLTRSIDSRLFVILAVAAYNKGSNTYAPGNSGHPVIQAINDGKSPDEIAATYVRAFSGIQGTKWGGLPNKFGLSALYYQGAVQDTTILNAIAEAPYTLEKHIRQNNNRLVTYDNKTNAARANGLYNPGNIDSLMLLTKYRKTQGTVQEPVKNYLTPHQCDVIQQGKLAAHVADFQDSIVHVTPQKMDASDELNAAGEEFYFDKKYAQAVEKFKAAIQKKPQNYIAYSNLAISYYKMDKYADGLKVVQDLIKSSHFAGMPDDIRGYTYYNVALCRMALGDNAQDTTAAAEHYTLARANLKLAEKFSGCVHEDMRKTLDAKINPAPHMRAAAAKVKSQSAPQKGRAPVRPKQEGR